MVQITTLATRPAVVRETTGERIRRLRLASDRSIRDLAADSGVNTQSIWRAEHDHDVYAYTLVALAKALDVCPCVLWEGSCPS